MKIFFVKNVRLLIFFSLLFFVFLTIYIFFLSENKTDLHKKYIKISDPLISFIEVMPGQYSSHITVYSQAVPALKTTIYSHVAGEVIWISDKLKKGMIVKKGEVLAKVNCTFYRSRLAQADLDLSNTKLNLLREEQEGKEAYLSWKRSGIEGLPDSSLVLRKPQLNVARKAVKAAKASLEAVQKEVELCEIKSLFQGLVVNSSASVGQLVASGDEIAQLYSTDKVIIEIHLDSDQWSMLEKKYKKTRVKLFSETKNTFWNATITREGQRILPQSRLRQIFCEIANPFEKIPPLLPGTFLTVELTGRKIPDLLKLPESTITKQNLVWYKGADNRLYNFSANTVFYRNGYGFIYPPKNIQFPVNIAVSPNTSFITGLKVKPKLAKLEG